MMKSNVIGLQIRELEQTVVANDYMSSFMIINKGVPQVSILGLFL